MKASFEESKQFGRSYDELFLKSVEAINRTGFKLIESNKVSGFIRAKVGITLRSFGEDISNSGSSKR